MVDGITWLASTTPSLATTLGSDWWATASDLDKWSAADPENMVRHVSVPKPTPQARERIADDARQSRGLSAQRAETVGVRCPRCHAAPGVACERVGRRSRRAGGLLGVHEERYAIAFPKAKPTAEKPATAAAPSASAPAKAAPKKTAASPGPSNKQDFPFAERRFREARHRHARASGNYLSTAHDGTSPKPAARVKFRPAAVASLRVSIGPVAWADITRLVQAENGNRETGGVLIGAVTNGTARVTHAIGPGSDAEQTMSTVRARVTQDEIDRVIASAKSKVVECGTWHSHPHGLGEPSKSDCMSLVADHEILGIEHPVMIIVRPSLTSGWAAPVPVAWMLFESDADGYDYDVRSANLTGRLS